MILQALADYYRRKRAQEPGSLPDPGFERRPIDFAIVLAADGRFLRLQDLRDRDGKRLTGRATRVPQAVKRTAGVAANLLWDNAGYVLGYDAKDNAERAAQQAAAFIARIRSAFPDPTVDPAIGAVLAFLEGDPLAAVQADPHWPELRESGGTVTFQLRDDPALVVERPAVRATLAEAAASEEGAPGLCLVSGTTDTVTRLHHPIKGVYGSKTTGGDIVSFNLDAFTSYGKQQGANAPVGARAAFAYTTALNHLLRWGSEQRLVVADTTLAFWSEEGGEMESFFTAALGDDPDRHTRAVAAVFAAYHTGAPPRPDDRQRFYVLGLAPNAARLAVRLWQRSTTRELGMRIRHHFELLQIDHGDHSSDHLPIRRLLRAIAVRQEDANIPPNLAGDTLRAILAGLPYPHSLLSAAVRRNRVEQTVDHPRAALIKACLNRQMEYTQSTEKELTMGLDEDNHNIGYRLGRLFLLLEQAQAAAIGSKRTLRERYFAVASTNPAAVFPRLLRMYNHYAAKLRDEKPGLYRVLDKAVTEVIEAVRDFPVTLSLEDQGRFAVGYYHQRQKFFTKKEPAAEPAEHA